MPESAYWLTTIAEGVAVGVWLAAAPAALFFLVVGCAWLARRRFTRWR